MKANSLVQESNIHHQSLLINSLSMTQKIWRYLNLVLGSKTLESQSPKLIPQCFTTLFISVTIRWFTIKRCLCMYFLYISYSNPIFLCFSSLLPFLLPKFFFCAPRNSDLVINKSFYVSEHFLKIFLLSLYSNSHLAVSSRHFLLQLFPVMGLLPTLYSHSSVLKVTERCLVSHYSSNAGFLAYFFKNADSLI